jgi:hypothetical protein
MVEGQVIPLSSLSSKGKTYPQDIEIYVRPQTLKEESSSTDKKFGISRAGYYEGLLNSISIKGCFDKKQLLFGDIQLIDLVRRLYTFELKELIYVDNCTCNNQQCNNKLNVQFTLDQVHFTDYNEDIFGKKFTFSDGLTITVSPITINDFIRISRKYLTNIDIRDDKPDLSDYVIAYYAASVTDVEGRVFENKESMFNYIFKYFSELTKNKDKKIINEMDKELTSTVVPFSVECDKCFEKTEVYLESSHKFRQD